jgi:hypothetical protein
MGYARHFQRDIVVRKYLVESILSRIPQKMYYLFFWLRGILTQIQKETEHVHSYFAGRRLPAASTPQAWLHASEKNSKVVEYVFKL